jgi:hypothetical protein
LHVNKHNTGIHRVLTVIISGVFNCIGQLLLTEQLKVAAGAKFDSTVDRLTFICAGKILRDEELLAEHNIVEGGTVHLVIKAAPSQVRQSFHCQCFMDLGNLCFVCVFIYFC